MTKNKIFKTIINAILIILSIDFLGFMFWIILGQYPVDGFYIGRYTIEIIKLLVTLF